MFQPVSKKNGGSVDLSKLKLETERLSLVAYDPSHSEQIFAGYRHPVIKYMNHGAPESLSMVQARAESKVAEMQRGEQLYVSVFKKDDKEFVGYFAVEDLSSDTPELGGWLKHEAHGHGYGREVVFALCEWARSSLKFKYLLWPCAIENTSSCKLAEALGGIRLQEYDKVTEQGVTWRYVDYAIYP